MCLKNVRAYTFEQEVGHIFISIDTLYVAIFIYDIMVARYKTNTSRYTILNIDNHVGISF